MSVTYRCRDCGADGFYPIVYGEDGYVDEHCPSCDSENIEQGDACPLCGRFTTDAYCDDCKQNLRERFSELLKSNFTPEEIKALNEIYDGEELR